MPSYNLQQQKDQSAYSFCKGILKLSCQLRSLKWDTKETLPQELKVMPHIYNVLNVDTFVSIDSAVKFSVL